jgi:CheY-like chemotaxis protein
LAVSGAEKRILLIDDDPDMHHAVRLMLEPAGYVLSCELTGAAGLEAIRRHPPDLILLDIMLAWPSEGFELAAALRDDLRLSRIPLIMISAMGEPLGTDVTRPAGESRIRANRFLEKPFKAQTLLAAVREILESGN